MTLVKSGTNQNTKLQTKIPKRVTGNGIRIATKETLLNLSKKKLITQSVVPKLVDVAREKGAFKRKQMYWNAYHCCETVYRVAGSLYLDESKYCKTRICAICCGIRKADLIHRYLPALIKWRQPYFVTLTIQSVPADQLKKLVNDMIKAFSRITEKYRKRNQRGRDIKLVGVKSIECNFNPKEQWYNPHLHIIVANKQMADILVNEWLSFWQGLTYEGAQYYRKVEDTEKDLIEVIKYSTKIFTRLDPKDKKKPKTENPVLIYIAAIDNIIDALEPHRVFDRFGFNLPPTKRAKGNYTKLDFYKEYHFDIKKADWLSVETAEPLSGYKPPPELEAMLGYNLNAYLE